MHAESRQEEGVIAQVEGNGCGCFVRDASCATITRMQKDAIQKAEQLCGQAISLSNTAKFNNGETK